MSGPVLHSSFSEKASVQDRPFNARTPGTPTPGGGAHQCHVPSVFSFRLLHGSACSIHESTGCWKRANTTEATWQVVTELWFCVLPARCLRAATVSSAESEELTNVWTPASVRNAGHILRTRGPSVSHIANSDGLFS